MNDDIRPAFQGEVMLLGWKESSSQGRTVTFLLNEDDETHPFRDLTVKQGKRAGQRFMAVLVAIGDDEAPVPAVDDLVAEAGAICRTKSFWEWADAQAFNGVKSEEDAKQFLYDQLSIRSRKELSTNQRAATRFRVIAAQFREWRSMRERDHILRGK